VGSATSIRVLRVAARIAGGSRRLRDRLGVRSAAMAAWLAGTEEPPAEVFLRALELVLDDLDRNAA
jgi:hypothetical protein